MTHFDTNLTVEDCQIIEQALDNLTQGIKISATQAPMVKNAYTAMFTGFDAEMLDNMTETIDKVLRDSGPLLDKITLIRAKVILTRRGLERKDKDEFLQDAIKATEDGQNANA